MNTKRTKGLTLMELVIALAVWLVLSAGVFFLWQHTSNASVNLLERQNALENARVAMDSLIISIQMSNDITLRTTDEYILQYIEVPGYNPAGVWHTGYRFDFTANLPPGDTNHNRLRFGGQERASYIARIYMTPTPRVPDTPIRRIDISIHTACNVPIILHGSVDVRYKNVYFNP